MKFPYSVHQVHNHTYYHNPEHAEIPAIKVVFEDEFSLNDGQLDELTLYDRLPYRNYIEFLFVKDIFYKRYKIYLCVKQLRGEDGVFNYALRELFEIGAVEDGEVQFNDKFELHIDNFSDFFSDSIVQNLSRPRFIFPATAIVKTVKDILINTANTYIINKYI